MFHGTRHAHGVVIITDPDQPHEVQRDTLQCCHCGMHFEVVKGSGRRRGFCMNCCGPTCGSRDCVRCYPYERQIEDIEKGLRL